MNRFSQHRSIRRRVALLAILPIFLVSATTQLRGETIRRDLVETAVAAGNFETLIAAVQAAGLVETLQQRGSFTVIAPTDAAPYCKRAVIIVASHPQDIMTRYADDNGVGVAIWR